MNKRHWVVIIASFCTVLIGFAIRNAYGVLLPEMLLSLKISKTEAGLIYGSFFMAYAVFSPILGSLADRINIRNLLTLFLGILGIGTFLIGYSSSFIDALFYFFLAGIGTSACWAPLVPLVQRWTSAKRRGITLGFVDIGSSLGIAVSSFIMPAVVAAYNWQMGWKGLGVLALFLAGINFLLVRDSPAAKPNSPSSPLVQPPSKPSVQTYSLILKDNLFLMIGISYLLIGFSTLIPLTFICTYAVQELNLRYDVATRLVTIIAVTSIVGKLAFGFLSDKLGRIKTIILCEIWVVAGNLGVVGFPDGLALSLSVAIFGFGHGAIWPLYALCAPDYFPKSSSGFIVGFWTLFLGIGFILSPVLAGWIADVTGRFIWSFILALSTAVISMLLLVLVEKKVPSTHSESKGPG